MDSGCVSHVQHERILELEGTSEVTQIKRSPSRRIPHHIQGRQLLWEVPLFSQQICPLLTLFTALPSLCFIGHLFTCPLLYCLTSSLWLSAESGWPLPNAVVGTDPPLSPPDAWRRCAHSCTEHHCFWFPTSVQASAILSFAPVKFPAAAVPNLFLFFFQPTPLY